MTIKEIFHKRYDELYDQTLPGHCFPQQPEEWVYEVVQEYTRLKCLEAIRNTRYKAIEILSEKTYNFEYEPIAKDIQNIRNQDVLPEL